MRLSCAGHTCEDDVDDVEEDKASRESVLEKLLRFHLGTERICCRQMEITYGQLLYKITLYAVIKMNTCSGLQT